MIVTHRRPQVVPLLDHKLMSGRGSGCIEERAAARLSKADLRAQTDQTAKRA